MTSTAVSQSVPSASEIRMQPDIKWITAVFTRTGIGTEERQYISVRANARSALQTMAEDIAESGGHVALYLPESADVPQIPEEERGRVIGLVELIPMAVGQRMEDFGREDWDGKPRWPIGWPCRMVCAPLILNCPHLRDHVESLFGAGAFGGYVKRFHKVGPFALEANMRMSLNDDFGDLCFET